MVETNEINTDMIQSMEVSSLSDINYTNLKAMAEKIDSGALTIEERIYYDNVVNCIIKSLDNDYLNASKAIAKMPFIDQITCNFYADAALLNQDIDAMIYLLAIDKFANESRLASKLIKTIICSEEPDVVNKLISIVEYNKLKISVDEYNSMHINSINLDKIMLSMAHNTYFSHLNRFSDITSEQL